MSLGSWLFGLIDRHPEAPLPDALAVGGGRVATLRRGREIHVFDADGRLLRRFEAETRGLSLSADGRWLLTAEGRLFGDGGEVAAEPAAFCCFVGDEALRVDPERVRLGPPLGPPRLDFAHAARLPLARPRVLAGPRLALLEPGCEEALLIHGGGVERLAPGRGPIYDAAWVGGRLHLVQEGALWADGAPASPRPHALQTLAVAARGAEAVTLGLGAKDRYELRLGEAICPLPGRAPDQPWLLLPGAGALLPTAEGILWTDGEARRTLELPRRRRGPRLAAPPALPDPGRLVLPLWPPAVYRVPDLQCIATFGEEL